VKCPECGSLLTVGSPKKSQSSKGDFNFGDDEPRSKRRDDDDDRPRRKRRDDDEDDDRPRSRRRDDEDDDEDRPRSRRRDRDDEDDDRPRSRRRDDDDDDRPRRRRRDDDDYDDYERPSRKESPAQFRNARTGMGLVGIGLWCQVGALGVAVFLGILRLADAYSTASDLALLEGLPALAYLVVALVGFSFILAGPKKGNLLGLTIALVAVAGIHLILVSYLAFGGAIDVARRFGPSIHWEALATVLPLLIFDLVLLDHFNAWILAAALLELARFILLALAIKELCRISKAKELGARATMMLIAMPALFGIMIILFLILKLVAKEVGVGGGGRAISFIFILLEYGGFIAIYTVTALLCGDTKQAISYRKSK